MKVVVNRTSLYGSEEQAPVDGAYLEEYDSLDERTFKSVEEHDSKIGSRSGAWLSRGFGHHQKPNGNIARYFKSKRWAADIESIEGFVRQHGDCVIQIEDDGLLKLEVYDSYRE